MRDNTENYYTKGDSYKVIDIPEPLIKNLRHNPDLIKEIIEFEERGFKYIPYIYPYIIGEKQEDGLRTPDGKNFSSSEIEKILTNLEPRNKKQIEFMEYLTYLDLVRKFNKNHD